MDEIRRERRSLFHRIDCRKEEEVNSEFFLHQKGKKLPSEGTLGSEINTD
jgi:hypothetical protein